MGRRRLPEVKPAGLCPPPQPSNWNSSALIGFRYWIRMQMSSEETFLHEMVFRVPCEVDGAAFNFSVLPVRKQVL